MTYNKVVALKNGKKCLLRNATVNDAEEVLDVFLQTHSESDFLLTYPDENKFDAPAEADYLSEKEKSDREIEICAVVDGKIVGTAGIDAVGSNYKVRSRAEFGVGIEKDHCGIGIGRALTNACIECARKAGYAQIELDVVADNQSAISLYRSVGFIEYGRNPRGFCSRKSGWQELVLMRLEL